MEYNETYLSPSNVVQLSLLTLIQGSLCTRLHVVNEDASSVVGQIQAIIRVSAHVHTNNGT